MLLFVKQSFFLLFLLKCRVSNPIQSTNKIQSRQLPFNLITHINPEGRHYNKSEKSNLNCFLFLKFTNLSKNKHTTRAIFLFHKQMKPTAPPLTKPTPQGCWCSECSPNK